MATARKRGNSWRVRVLDHVEYDAEGNKKKIYHSITVNDPTREGKKEAERLAAEYAQYKKGASRSITVHDAIKMYIDLKEDVLSSSTVMGYRGYLKSGAYRPIDVIYLKDLKKVDVQRWVSTVAKKRSSKYVHNLYALLTASLAMADMDPMRITLPAPAPREINVPTDAELTAFMQSIKDDKELTMAVMLAAFGSLRRSEICALTPKDVHGCEITVNKSMVRGRTGYEVRKKTKTADSARTTVVPLYVVRAMDMKRERIVMISPTTLTDRFRAAVEKAGLPKKFTLHGLRHYYVSIAHALGISDAYTMKTGGWRTDAVMKRNYRTTLSDYEEREREKFMSYFDKMHDPEKEEKPKPQLKLAE